MEKGQSGAALCLCPRLSCQGPVTWNPAFLEPFTWALISPLLWHSAALSLLRSILLLPALALQGRFQGKQQAAALEYHLSFPQPLLDFETQNLMEMSITPKYLFAETLGNHCAKLASHLYIEFRIKMHHGFPANATSGCLGFAFLISSRHCLLSGPLLKPEHICSKMDLQAGMCSSADQSSPLLGEIWILNHNVLHFTLSCTEFPLLSSPHPH